MLRKIVTRLFIAIAASLLVVTVLIPCMVRLYQEISGQTAEPHPPDLSGCTRIEIRHERRQQRARLDLNLLTVEEEQLRVSMDKLTVVEDAEYIADLACAVRSARYESLPPQHERMPEYVHVTAYRNSDEIASFIMFSNRLETQSGHVFVNSRLSPCLTDILSNIWPFQWRLFCALGLTELGNTLKRVMANESGPFAIAKWCDAVEEYKRPRSFRRYNVFRCPAQREGRSNYAMNPNCKPDSPPEMVLLFETRGGWNQHGGPELFTFDNHDPRGGCVLLNDGTVKFIRTEEELKQLRWK